MPRRRELGGGYETRRRGKLYAATFTILPSNLFEVRNLWGNFGAFFLFGMNLDEFIFAWVRFRKERCLKRDLALHIWCVLEGMF